MQGRLVLARQPLNKDEREEEKRQRKREEGQYKKATHPPAHLKKKKMHALPWFPPSPSYTRPVFFNFNFPIQVFLTKKNTQMDFNWCDFIDSSVGLRRFVGELAAQFNRFLCV